jgi:Tol biopolymer transport system component
MISKNTAARRRIIAGLLGLLLIVLTGLPLAAQGGPDGGLFITPTPRPPLTGPLLAGSRPQNDGIFLYDIGTGETRDLHFGRGRQWPGAFSPDGCQLAFVMSDPAGRNMRLYSADLAGENVRELVDFTDDSGAIAWEVWSPAWSPAGDRIAFILIRDYLNNGERSRTTHLAVIPAEGGVPALYSISGSEGTPVWSPDGAWLAYTSYEIGEANRRENDIWIVSADGGTKYQLTDFASGSTLFPRWSPNGEVVSFIYAPSGNNHQFWTTPASGGTVQKWSDTWTLVLGYDWLPDGSGLVAAIKGWQGNDDGLLWRVPLPGYADTDATLYLDHPDATAVDYPRFSPDGRYLAFRSVYNAVLYDTTTQTLQLLETVGLNNSPLVWGPWPFDGQRCYNN